MPVRFGISSDVVAETNNITPRFVGVSISWPPHLSVRLKLGSSRKIVWARFPHTFILGSSSPLLCLEPLTLDAGR